MRECGSCTACCQGWLASIDLDMRPGKPCKHVCDSGCSIYEDRPVSPCRQFECQWLQHPDRYDDDLRPDISGVIISGFAQWNSWNVMHLTPTGSSIHTPSLDRIKVIAKSLRTPIRWTQYQFDDDNNITSKSDHGWGPPSFIRLLDVT